MTHEEILAILNARCAGTLMETLSIEYTGMTQDTLTARMPVTPAHTQPLGLLHGGATVSLAETVGSAASHIFLDDPHTYVAVGQEIAANHVRSARNGTVTCMPRQNFCIKAGVPMCSKFGWWTTKGP